MLFRADFHIHSCLSPCASLEMSPNAIVRQARSVGLTALALSDHNCAFNLPAFDEICAREGMACLYGIEVTSIEEVHNLCLFDDLGSAMDFGQKVYDSLPPIPNQPDRFGDQPIVNADDEILGMAEKFLINASSYDIGTLLEEVHALGGLFIPAHIDRQVFGMISQLGFLPQEDFDAVELTVSGDPALALDYPVVHNSDSHQLDRLGSAYTDFEVGALTVKTIRAALYESP